MNEPQELPKTGQLWDRLKSAWIQTELAREDGKEVKGGYATANKKGDIVRAFTDDAPEGGHGFAPVPQTGKDKQDYDEDRVMRMEVRYESDYHTYGPDNKLKKVESGQTTLEREFTKLVQSGYSDQQALTLMIAKEKEEARWLREQTAQHMKEHINDPSKMHHIPGSAQPPLTADDLEQDFNSNLKGAPPPTPQQNIGGGIAAHTIEKPALAGLPVLSGFGIKI